MGIYFEIEIFILRCVLDHFISIPIKKIRPKFFVFPIFSTYDPNFIKKWLCLPKIVIMVKFFEIEIFISKYLLNNSELIPIKNKFFEQKFLFLPFFRPKWPKLEFLEFFGRKFFFQKKNRTLF